jgi:hypothetical protein
MSTDDIKTTDSTRTSMALDVLAWIAYVLLASWVTMLAARCAMSLPSVADQ